MRIRSLFLWLVLIAAPASAQADEPQVPLEEAFAQTVLVVVATRFACHRLDIYIAETREQTRRGLMFVRELPPMTGMLFIYDRDAYHSMWMKNTFIPLDMLFIRADGSVSSIVRDTEPRSEKSISSIEPVRFVLELNAGTSERLGIDTESYLVL